MLKGGRLELTTGCELCETVESRLIAKPVDCLDQPLVVKEPDEREVKVTIGLEEPDDVAFLGGFKSALDKDVAALCVGRPKLAGDLSNGGDFENDPDLKNLV